MRGNRGGAGRRATASDISMPVARCPTHGVLSTAGGIALRSRAARSPLRGRSLCGLRTCGSRRSPEPKRPSRALRRSKARPRPSAGRAIASSPDEERQNSSAGEPRPTSRAAKVRPPRRRRRPHIPRERPVRTRLPAGEGSGIMHARRGGVKEKKPKLHPYCLVCDRSYTFQMFVPNVRNIQNRFVRGLEYIDNCLDPGVHETRNFIIS